LSKCYLLTFLNPLKGASEGGECKEKIRGAMKGGQKEESEKNARDGENGNHRSQDIGGGRGRHWKK